MRLGELSEDVRIEIRIREDWARELNKDSTARMLEIRFRGEDGRTTEWESEKLILVAE